MANKTFTAANVTINYPLIILFVKVISLILIICGISQTQFRHSAP